MNIFLAYKICVFHIGRKRELLLIMFLWFLEEILENNRNKSMKSTL